MAIFKVFIVEDDKIYANILQYHLALNPDYEVETYHTGDDLLKNLHKKPQAITLDHSLPDYKSDKLLKKIRDIAPEIPVIVISGQEDISLAISLLKEGVYDYIVKNEDTNNRLWVTIKNLRDAIGLKNEVEFLKEEVQKKYEFSSIIKGNSQVILRTFELMQKACGTNINVSITGETGTGKELVAKAIHYNSNRKSKKFVAVNTAAIPKELIESELFGYEKGAFTGANFRRIGWFEEAHQGTLFLDEIGELDINLQAKLLRTLQEKEVLRVGSNSPVKIDVRIIVATHKNLQDEVKKGNFREDLYYRLLGLPISLPPLRERGNDILILAKFFLEEFCKLNNLPLITFGHDAKEKLLKYAYPGNIRELKAIIELAAVLCNDKLISADDITFNSINSAENFLQNETTLEDYTNQIINHFLKKYDNNVQIVAQKLNIGKSTIYRMLQDQKIQEE